MNKFRVVSAIVLMALILSCINAVAQQRDRNSKDIISLHINRNEDIGLMIQQYSQDMALERMVQEERGLIGTAIDFAANFASSALFSIIDNVKKSRSATWTAPSTKDYFYSGPSFLGAMDPSGIQFNGFELSRNVKSEDGTLSPAFFIRCSLPQEQVGNFMTNTRFTLELDTLAVDLSRIKARYTNRKTVSIEVVIKLIATWIDEGLVVHSNQQLGEFRIALPNLKYNPDKPIVSFSGNKVAGMINGCSFFVPRSFSPYVDGGQYNKCWSPGEFEIQLTIRESTARNKNEASAFVGEYFKKALPESIKSMTQNENIVGPSAVKIIKGY